MHGTHRDGYAARRSLARLIAAPYVCPSLALSGMFSRRAGACRAVRYLPYSPRGSRTKSLTLELLPANLTSGRPRHMITPHEVRGTLMVNQKRQSHVVAVLARGQLRKLMGMFIYSLWVQQLVVGIDGLPKSTFVRSAPLSLASTCVMAFLILAC